MEQSSDARADRFNAAVSSILEVLDGVSPDDLHDRDTFVRLYVTLGEGAHTIPAAIIRRLADVNATIWIDA